MSVDPNEIIESGSQIHQAAFHGEELAREIEKLIGDPHRRIIPMNRRTLDEVMGALRNLSSAVQTLDFKLRKYVDLLQAEANKKEN
jgi:uncharacterized protein YoxC